MTLHYDNTEASPYLRRIVALLLFASYCLLSPKIVLAKPKETFQPTGPCVVVICPRPEVATEPTAESASPGKQGNATPRLHNKPSERSEIQMPPSRKLLEPNLRPAESSTQTDKISVTDEKQLDRILACQAAFLKFSEDGKGGRLNWNKARDYLDKCFHKADDLPSKLKQQLYATIVALQTNDGGSYCTGSLLNTRLVLTARHCLLNQSDFEDDPRRPINPALLPTLVIKGIDTDGNAWTRKATSIHFDPFDASTQAKLVGAFKNRMKQYPRTFDFVAIQLDSPLITTTTPINLATEQQIASLTVKQRLLVGFYRQDTKEGPPTLYVDDLPSCLIREVDAPRGYLHHHCQTYTSVSGAAIFSYPSTGALATIAVHVAPAGNTIPLEKNPVTGNEGVLTLPSLKDLQ